jgi:hypothetical protein
MRETARLHPPSRPAKFPKPPLAVQRPQQFKVPFGTGHLGRSYDFAAIFTVPFPPGVAASSGLSPPAALRLFCTEQCFVECVMPKIELDGLPVIDAAESDTITVAVDADDLQAGDAKKPERHPVAIALRRQRGVDDARVSKREVLIRRGNRWFRYEPSKPVQS